MSDEQALVTRAPMEIASFEELQVQTQRLSQFYKGLMVEGTDYGVIPGTNKPTLLKPGAELLRAWAGVTPQFEVDDTGTDLERGIFFYQVKCSLYKGDKLVGEGVGSCNSLESKYRYRWVSARDVPPGIDRSTLVSKENTNRKSGGKWWSYRIENDNPQDIANTVLKMAKKRSFVDGILTVTGASRIFTQDIEDMPETGKPTPPPSPEKPKVKATKSSSKVDKVQTKVDKAEEPVTDELEDKTGSPEFIQPGEVEVVTIEGGVISEGPPKPKITRDPSTVTTIAEMYSACFTDFQAQPAEVMADLNIKANSDIVETPWDCYVRFASVREANPPSDKD